MNVPVCEAAPALDRVVQFGDITYPFLLRSGSRAWDELDSQLAALGADCFVVVTDSGVPASIVQSTAGRVGAHGRVLVHRIPAGEKGKDLAAVADLAAAVIKAGATRSTVVVGLGGGVAGNVAGLCAGLLFRGVRLVQMPTTFLAMSDSVLSLKQAVNSPAGKNHLGLFKAPVLVWGFLDFLASLPRSEIRAGLCETAKNVLAICPARYDALAALLRPAADYSAGELAWLVGLCADAKQSVMAADPYERREALVLEYGHTAGHAAEHLTSGAVGHGLAIGVGMLVAARASALLGWLTAEAEEAHEYLLARNGTPLAFPAGVGAADLMQVTRRDNKRGYVPLPPQATGMVLLDALGRPHRHNGQLITPVPERVLLAAIRSRTTQ